MHGPQNVKVWHTYILKVPLSNSGRNFDRPDDYIVLSATPAKFPDNASIYDSLAS